MSRRDPFDPFDPFEGFGRRVAGLGLLVVVLNLALLAGGIAVVVIVLRALGVIG